MILYVSILLIFFSLNSTNGLGNVLQQEILKAETGREIDDEALALFYQARNHRVSDEYDQALNLFEKAFTLFTEQENLPMIAETHVELGLTYFSKPDIDKAIENFGKALELSIGLQDSTAISIAYYNLARSYRKTGKLDEAIEYSFKSLDYQEENNHEALNIISIVYGMMGKLDESLEYQKKVLEIRESLGLKDKMIGSISNMGIISRLMKNPEQALEYYLRAIQIAEETDRKKDLNTALNNVGALYEDELGEPEKAMQYYQQSLQISQEIQDHFSTALAFINIGNLKSEMGEYSGAISNLERGLSLAKKIQIRELIMNAYQAISKHDERQHKFRSALENYRSFIAIKDSIFSEQSDKIISELQIKYETEKKEKENDLYRLQIEKEKAARGRLYFGIIIIAFLSVVLFYLYMHKKRTNKLLTEARRKLELSNQELEAFTRSVSHDLKAPLRAINHYSRVLLEDYDVQLDDKGNKDLQIIRQNAGRMNQLISDLLDLSRISRAELKLVEVDMRRMVEEVFEESATDSEKQSFHITVSDLPPVQCDPVLIRQVWQNLIINALKFSVKSEIKKIKVGFRADKEAITFFIRDYGAGFDPEYSGKLFGVFQRLHKESEFKGTGIGLSIVQRIIHRHQGTVGAEGQLNHGATFYFSLPKRG